MNQLPDNWKELSRRDYLDGEFHGKFVDAWGRKGDDGKYDKIIGVYYYEMRKYPQGQVYVFDSIEYGKTKLQSLAEKIIRQDSIGKPVLKKESGKSVGTANTPEEAIQVASEHI